MKKLSIINLQFTIPILLLILAASLILLTTYYLLPTVYAQAASCNPQVTNPRVQRGLISTPDITGSQDAAGIVKFSNSTGTCVTTDKAAFVPYKVPGYEDLKSLYYTQSKAIKVLNSNTNISPVTNADDGKVYNYTAADVEINGVFNYHGTAVIFIEHNLHIKNAIFAQSPSTLQNSAAEGLVLVVGGDVFIDKTIAQINAIIISSGYIYTAADTSTTPSTPCSHTSPVSDTTVLTVNGSLISLDANKGIEFCRTLGASNSTAPAEVINIQPKYLVILRNLFADTLQKWSEIQ